MKSFKSQCSTQKKLAHCHNFPVTFLGKNVSITSLECIHACCPPTESRDTPTVFFYERHITNMQNVEDQFKWVFDYEYVTPDVQLPPDVQYQYVRSYKARVYEDDKNGLNKYIQQLPYVKWSKYECYYEKGMYQLVKVAVFHIFQNTGPIG